jgi:putative ABC transport system permease protein
MHTLRALGLRLLALFHSRRSGDDFAAELESHVALHTDDGIRAGLTPEEARRQALIRLGGAEQTRQAHRERRTLPWLDSLLQDTRYGLRTLRRSPGFTITAVLTLALGIGACTAIFSLVNAVLIRSLPYGDPGRLVYLFTPNPHIPVPPDVMTPSYADFYDIKRQSHFYSDMSVFEQATYNLSLQGSVERVSAARVDESFFTTLQSAPEFGRAIGADDNQPGHDKVAVISHALWRSMFAGSTDVLERSLPLNGVSYRIVGVMPPAFEYPLGSDLPYGNVVKGTHIWIPLALTSKQKAERELGNVAGALARIRPGVSITHAQSEMSTIMVRLDKLHGVSMFPERGWGALVKSFMDYAVGQVGRLLWLLLGAVTIVLLIACGNAANLLLARASNRMRELGVRVALGAGRRRIIRQLLTESLLIGLVAGVIGVGLAGIFLRFLPLLDPGNIPRLNQASLDIRVMLFTILVSLLTSVLAGILPALAVSRVSPGVVLAAGSSGNVAGVHGRSQSTLIVVEAALVVVLLACAGLLIRSYINVESVDTGFSPSTVTVNIGLDPRYSQPQQRRALFRNFISKVAALPGVSAVGAVSYLPLSNSESLGYIWVDGFANSKDQMAEGRGVTPQYFAAMSIPLIAGRYFTEDDDSKAERPIIINQRFAQLYFAHRNPLGGRIRQEDNQWSTIVGVVADVRHSSLEETPQPQMYGPSYDLNGAYIAVRSLLPRSTVASELRSTLKSLDPGLPFGDVRTMGDLISEATARRRFQTSLLTVFAAIALLLALVGLYGLMAYSVSRRTRELGIRMALGAQRPDVMLLVIKRAALLLGLGVASGLACSWIATRAIKAFLFGVGEHDPATILLVCILLAVCGLAAALIPARRAASIDPMQALRTE